MKKLAAQYNYARWIAICPKCLEDGRTVAMEVTPGDHFICPEEHPDILAKTLVPNPRVAGAFNAVPDLALREEAKKKAVDQDDAFEVVFPKNKAEIERILRVRPREGRNWWQGVPIEDLVRENQERGVNA